MWTRSMAAEANDNEWKTVPTRATTRRSQDTDDESIEAWEDLPPHTIHTHITSNNSIHKEPASIPLMVVDAVPTTVTTMPTDSSSCSTSSFTISFTVSFTGLSSTIRMDRQSPPPPPPPPGPPPPAMLMLESTSTTIPEQPPMRVMRPSRSWDMDTTTNTDQQEQQEPWRYPGRNQVMRFRGKRNYMYNPEHRRKRSRDYTFSETPRKRWLIPAEHPIKLLWDFLTIVLSIANAYATHAAIRDRAYGSSLVQRFCELWFVVDILLNFVTERQIAEGVILQDFQSVCARYLTTWFVVDLVSLIPGELMYVKPIIDAQNRRGWIKRYFFKTKAVVRVTRSFRGRHVKLFGKVARHTKRAGMGVTRLLRVIIKYVPRYLLFLRNMKGVVAVRVLRQVHFLRKVWRNMVRRTRTPLIDDKNDDSDDDTYSLTDGYDDDDDDDDEFDDDFDFDNHNDAQGVEYQDDGWEFVDDHDDDGDPY